MAISPVVSSLPAYVEQRRLPLLSKAVLGAKTARLFTIQSGIKGAAKLNLINSDIVLQSGASCGWNEAGTSTLTQRELNTALLKVNMAYCDKKLIRTWAEYGVRIVNLSIIFARFFPSLALFVVRKTKVSLALPVLGQTSAPE